MSSNPVLKGFYADPEIVKFGDAYYIYPTTDGFYGWAGTQFHLFSSMDKIVWKDEGVILDVATEDVMWAIGSAWAPAITYKNEKYYFYFTAKREDGVSCIGVAVSDAPTGPFKAMKEPLITMEMLQQKRIPMCQIIDPSIFIDEDETAYLLFGNGIPAIVTLNEDMLSIQQQTLKALEGAYDFREAISVMKRDRYYHFTWSCDDTRSENYHVNYGIADNIYGPINYKYAILEKSPEKDILGTGHHSIIKDSDEDKYYIAYHRFSTPLTRSPEENGYHREICIDCIQFSEEGLMKPVSLT
jgi:Beta-xylosidase